MQLQQHENKLKALCVEVLVVTFQSGPTVENYVRESDLAWPILIDDSLSLYTAYEMGRGSWWQILGPASWGEYLKLLLRGRRLRRPTADPYQLGGDVLIDPLGVIRLHHVGRNPADRPPISALLQVVRRIQAETENRKR